MRQCVRRKIAEGSSRITGKGHPYPLHAPQPQLIARGRKGPVTFLSSARTGAQKPQVQDLKFPAAVLATSLPNF